MNIFGKSDKGLARAENQDVFTFENIGKGVFMLICDGMGGANAGNVASSIAVDEIVGYVRRSISDDEDIKEAKSVIRSGLRSANDKIYASSQKDTNLSGMGTTAVVAYVKGSRAIFMNIGDSRAYIISGTSIKQITTDHSVVEKMVISGQITRDEAKNHPSRNLITMALGPDKDILPDYFESELSDKDIILLCSDGLSTMLDDEQILSIVSSKDSVENKCNRLIDAANGNGGKDNVTVLIYEHDERGTN